MKARPLIAVLCAALLASQQHGQSFQAAAGGRDLTIALFSTHHVTRAVLTPLTGDAWTATCANCPHRLLQGPLILTAPTHLFAGGTLRATDTGSGLERTLTGLWQISTLAAANALSMTATLPSERYVEAVLNAEADPAEPPASLRALAIVARTFALNGPHYTAPPGALPADLCDTTACQAVLFGPVRPALSQAVRETAGETLWFRGKRAQVFFSQHCGGITEDSDALSPKLANVPYLRSHPDPFCLRQGAAAWHADLPVQQLLALPEAQSWRLALPLSAASVTQRTRTGRALTITLLVGPGRRPVSLSARSFRLAVGRALGWSLVRSDLYQLALRNNTLVLDGRGHGHGVGLCQTGAAELAHSGRTARDILAFYFPGTTVGIGPSDTGWQQAEVGPLLLRTTGSMSPDQQASLVPAWTRATRLLPTARPIAPVLVIAPSTELFRQLTHQAGWALASTSGSTTVLQPPAVLAANHVALSALLLHEFLHIRVEASSGPRAPLWLREGLVEVLAADPIPRSSATMPVPAIDSGLQQPRSSRQALAAHAAAALRVRDLLHQYGLATIQGWLANGVPSGVA